MEADLKPCANVDEKASEEDKLTAENGSVASSVPVDTFDKVAAQTTAEGTEAAADVQAPAAAGDPAEAAPGVTAEGKHTLEPEERAEVKRSRWGVEQTDSSAKPEGEKSDALLPTPDAFNSQILGPASQVSPDGSVLGPPPLPVPLPVSAAPPTPAAHQATYSGGPGALASYEGQSYSERPQRPERGDRSNVTCYSCHGLGHFSRDCPNRGGPSMIQVGSDLLPSQAVEKDGVTLFVFHLPDTATEEDLRTMFNNHGTVVRSFIARDNNSMRHKGYGFVTMTNLEEAKRCIAVLHGQPVGPKFLSVSYKGAPAPEKGRPNPSPSAPAPSTGGSSHSGGYRGNSSPHFGGGRSEDGVSLFVFHICEDVSEKELLDLFIPFQATRCNIARDPTGRTKGYAFISVPTQDLASAAIGQMNGRQVRTKHLAVSLARRKLENAGSSYGTTSKSSHERGPPPSPAGGYPPQQSSYGSSYSVPPSQPPYGQPPHAPYDPYAYQPPPQHYGGQNPYNAYPAPPTYSQSPYPPPPPQSPYPPPPPSQSPYPPPPPSQSPYPPSQSPYPPSQSPYPPPSQSPYPSPSQSPYPPSQSYPQSPYPPPPGSAPPQPYGGYGGPYGAPPPPPAPAPVPGPTAGYDPSYGSGPSQYGGYESASTAPYDANQQHQQQSHQQQWPNPSSQSYQHASYDPNQQNAQW